MILDLKSWKGVSFSQYLRIILTLAPHLLISMSSIQGQYNSDFGFLFHFPLLLMTYKVVSNVYGLKECLRVQLL